MWIRQELLHWLNSLLQLNVTKVEQCGTGYVLEARAPRSSGCATTLDNNLETYDELMLIY